MVYVNTAVLASAGALLLQGALAQSPAGPWQQCGGNNWTGATTCTSGYTCSKLNEWYHQCVPGSAPETSTTRTTLSTSTRPGTPTTTSPPTPGDPNLPAIPSTLLPSHYFIRAVATPYYHSYLRAQPTRVPGKAYLEDPPGAGQFRLEGSQLVHNIGEGAAPLYLNVEKPADLTQRKLATEFKTTQNTFGTFAFQGDTLIWSTPEINRPNSAAWLICENKEVFINTGAFLYDTPPGCSDQTIHSYGGSTPDL